MAVIKLKIYVSNLTNVMTLFDQIQVWRSEDGEDGTYFEITADAATTATLIGTEEGPFTLNGKTLKVNINGGSEQTITFVSADPINITDLVSFINGLAISGLLADDHSGSLCLYTVATGTGATLEITGGTALTELGFEDGDKDNGEDERIDLDSDTSYYEYDDQSGDSENYYKVRYYDSVTFAVSSYGDPVQGDVGSIVPPSDLVKGYSVLAKMNGQPSVGTAVIFYNVFIPPLTIGDIGIIGREIRVETDADGYFETMLIKGSIVDVTISGTGIVRRITVPDADFNVMSAVAVADDNFQIQVPDIPAAVRRS